MAARITGVDAGMATDAPFGALLQLRALPGRRDDVLHVVPNYLSTLGALQLELGDLLTQPPAVRPLAPIARRTSPGVAAE